MSAYLRCAALLVVIGLFLIPAGATAQDLGGVAVWASSPNAELPHPRGMGLFAHFEGAGLGFRISLVRYSDSTFKEGVVCRVYSPRIGCGIEGVDTSVRLGGLRMIVLKSLALGGVARLGAGGGVSFNALTSTSTGDSGRPADLHIPNTGQIGYEGALTLSVVPVPGVPLKLVGSYALHWVHFRGCVDPEDPTSGYAPFCGMDRFRELELGASFLVPRR